MISKRILVQLYLCLVASMCVESSEYYEVLPSYSGVENCTSTQFKCLSGECIDLSKNCDSSLDCDDGSDEENCSVAECQPGTFRCASGCISESRMCDGVEDCDDGLDEKNCSFTCPANQFACVLSKECVSNQYRCDGNHDCVNSEDEENCDLEGSVAPSCADQSQFRCVSDGQCIAGTQRCDGSRHCIDGSDELNCTAPNVDVQSCAADEFACRATAGMEVQCLSLKRRCDKFVDCHYGDDEVGCGSAPANDSYNIDADPLFICDRVTQFKCSSTNTCVSKSALCNQVSDCRDGEDEQKCELNPEHDPCSPSDLGECEHLCVASNATRGGRPRYQCACKPGFRLAGPYICADVDECAADVSPCSHHCENSPGSFICSCKANYKLDADKRTCRANDGDKLLFVLTPDQLLAQRIGSPTSDWLTLRNLTDANAFDLDVSMQLLFWSTVQPREGNSQREAGIHMSNWAMQPMNSARQQLIRSRIDHTLDMIQKSTNQATKSNQVEAFLRQMKGGAIPSRTVVDLYKDANAQIEAVAFDWVNKLVFWTDSYYRHVVAFSLLTGRTHVVLSGLRKPRALALDPAFGTIYLIDGTDNDVSIISVAMDGSDRVTILDSSFVSMPYALTIDYTLRRLLFVDSNRAFIGSCSLDVPSAAIGATCRQLHSFGTAASTLQPSLSTQALSTFEDELYWIEGPAKLHACSRSSCATAQRTLLPERYVRGVNVAHTLRQQTDSTPCVTASGYQCPFMCLPTRRNRTVDALSARCVCAQGENFVAGPLPLTGKCVGKETLVPTREAAPTVRPMRPVDGQRDAEGSNVEEEDFEFGRVAIIIGVLLGVVIIAILIAVLVYRSYTRRDGKAMSMNFENPVYGKPISIAMPQFYATGGSSMVDVAGNNYALSDPDGDRHDETEAFPDAERGSDASLSYTASPIRRPLNVASDPSETHRLTEAGDMSHPEV